MSQEWFVVRNGKEQGPLSGQQLKQMAAAGKLQPTDPVRLGATGAPRQASTIKGLFAEDDAVPAVQPTSPKEQPKSNTKLPLILGGVAAGVFVLCCSSCGFMAFFGNKARNAFDKEMAEADAQWRSGKKAEAAAFYRSKRDSAMLEAKDRPLVYGRLIDFEYESGRADAGRALIEEADKKGVTPVVSHADAKARVDAMVAEKARIEAEKAEQKRLAEAKKKDEERW